jgi:F0F1-type ATP synthase assembly protein I
MNATSTAAKPRKAKSRKLTGPEQRRLVEAFLKEKDTGKEAYARADELLEKIIAGVPVGLIIGLAGRQLLAEEQGL